MCMVRHPLYSKCTPDRGKESGRLWGFVASKASVRTFGCAPVCRDSPRPGSMGPYKCTHVYLLNCLLACSVVHARPNTRSKLRPFDFAPILDVSINTFLHQIVFYWCRRCSKRAIYPDSTT